MLWHELSWPRIGQADKDLPVLLPLGSIEQHGHHLPVAVDTIQVSGIAERVERELGDGVLLVPTLWLGCSEHHKDFPGTISVGPALYADVIKRLAASILRAGFRKLFFLNGHGGNRIPAAQALNELIAEDDDADNAYLALASWWEIAAPEIAADRLGMASARISHACEYETSLMLALRPELVEVSKARRGKPVIENRWHYSEDDGRKRVAVFRRFHRLTAAGSLGDPTQATADKGRALLGAVASEVAAFIKDFRAWPELPKLGPALPGRNGAGAGARRRRRASRR